VCVCEIGLFLGVTEVKYYCGVCVCVFVKLDCFGVIEV
jgi:hypothetical protein